MSRGFRAHNRGLRVIRSAAQELFSYITRRKSGWGSGKAGETAGTGKGARGQGWGRSMRRGREGTSNHTHTQGFWISLILIRRTNRTPRQPESVDSEFTYGIVGRDVHDTDALAN